MKKIIVVAIALCACMLAEARSMNNRCPGPAPRPMNCRPCRPCPPPMPHGNCRGGSMWGKGGRNFLPAFAGAAIGSLVGTALANSSEPDVVIVEESPRPALYTDRYYSRGTTTIIKEAPVIERETVIYETIPAVEVREVTVPRRTTYYMRGGCSYKIR